MDENTKALLGSIRSSNPQMARVMADLLASTASDETIRLAAELETEDPILWRENQWLRMVAGTTPGQMDEHWNNYLRNEMEEEANEPA